MRIVDCLKGYSATACKVLVFIELGEIKTKILGSYYICRFLIVLLDIPNLSAFKLI